MAKKRHTHNSHADIVDRLKRAHGHLAKIISMIEAEEPCVEVAQQFQAVCKALSNAKVVYVQEHIDGCLSAENLKNMTQRKQAVLEFQKITKYLT